MAIAVGAMATDPDSAPVARTQQRDLVRLHPTAVAAAVLCVLAVLAGLQLALFWPEADQLWWRMTHDRSAHYLNGLNLALDARSADLPQFIHDLDAMRVWGPLHPALLAVVQLCAGPNFRLAVLPSLLGWVGTAWFGFLVARRMVTQHGTAAGLIAATLIAVSPAHRAFATDNMLQSVLAGHGQFFLSRQWCLADGVRIALWRRTGSAQQ
jgi:hypothetical protein